MSRLLAYTVGNKSKPKDFMVSGQKKVSAKKAPKKDKPNTGFVKDIFF